ncbi:MAG: phosphate/phosphite/phosphonate ABC transporter substrate-binding protein [Nitrospirae bacterium]|nr:phosphate/phosphite/phosphonate ABC transporter substrate-binding protein [Nitrospirota bacterium]
MRVQQYIFVLVLAGLLSLPSISWSEQEKLLIGLIPEMNVFKQRERFQPLADYLSKKIGVRIKLTIFSKYGGIVERFKSLKLDGAFFGSYTGAAAIKELGVEPLARPVNLDGSSTYHGYIFVRKESGINNVADMKGKRMAFVDRATTAGYIFPMAYLKENGVENIDKYFKEYFFTGSHDAAIYAVLDKKADIGAAKHSVYDRVRLDNPRIDKELVILTESPKVPSNGLCVRRSLNKSLKEKLKNTLLNMDNDPDAKVVLEKFGALRFIETTADDYKPVFDILKRAGVEAKQ